MIIDRERFLKEERPLWRELEALLDGLEQDATRSLNLDEAKRFHYLYRRASADLSKIATFAAEPRIHGYLEALVGRAYSEIHETRRRSQPAQIAEWVLRTVPRAFRRHVVLFYLATLITLMGSAFGTAVILFDYDSKYIIMPFRHLAGDPSERVAWEESAEEDRLEGRKTSFSAFLWVNNTRVSIMALALGMTFGIGTTILLFYNGAILGAVAADYVLAGESTFLMGWLLPHGVIEIPAILIGGQAGLVLGRALIGFGTSENMRTRFRSVSGDLVTLIFAVAIMLVWAGLVEAFFSQYHEPYLPYGAKIAFGAIELIALFLYLGLSGRKGEKTRHSGEAGEPEEATAHA